MLRILSFKWKIVKLNTKSLLTLSTSDWQYKWIGQFGKISSWQVNELEFPERTKISKITSPTQPLTKTDQPVIIRKELIPKILSIKIRIIIQCQCQEKEIKVSSPKRKTIISNIFIIHVIFKYVHILIYPLKIFMTLTHKFLSKSQLDISIPKEYFNLTSVSLYATRNREVEVLSQQTRSILTKTGTQASGEQRDKRRGSLDTYTCNCLRHLSKLFDSMYIRIQNQVNN